MRPNAFALIAALGLTITSTGLRAESGRAVLMRHHPTDVRWGEVAIGEATRVQVPLPAQSAVLDGVRTEDGDDPLETVEFAYALSVSFLGRSRKEELEAIRSGERLARSDVAPYGSVMLAVNTKEGRKGWDRFREELVSLTGQISPAGYASFLERFSARVQDKISDSLGEFSLSYCTAVEGGAESAGTVYRKPSTDDQGGAGIESGSTAFSETPPVCSALRSALQYVSPSEVRMTDLQIEETIEETLSLAAFSRPDPPPGPWPEGAKLDRAEAPAGATSYERGSVSDEVSHYEELRMAGRGQDGGKPHLLVADVPPSSLGRKLADGRALLTRWTVQRRLRHLGVEPRTLQEDTEELILALFPAGPLEELGIDDLARAVASSLEKESGLLDTVTLREALVRNNASLRGDRVLRVTCRTKNQVEAADYCLAKACARVLNPAEFCAAVRSAMSQ